MKKVSVFFMSTIVALMTASYVHAEKIMARKIVIVDAYEFRQNATLCKGIAVDAGNSYIQLIMPQNEKDYCRDTLKKRMLFPASSCSLTHMIGQCLDQIEFTKHLKKDTK